MVLFGIILTLVAGMLVAAFLILKFNPDSKSLINKMVPYQGIFGQLLFSKSEEAQKKGEAIRVKLAGHQGVFGIALIGLSIWSVFQMI